MLYSNAQLDGAIAARCSRGARGRLRERARVALASDIASDVMRFLNRPACPFERTPLTTPRVTLGNAEVSLAS